MSIAVRRWMVILIPLLVVMVIGASLYETGTFPLHSDSPSFSGTILDPITPAPDFQLEAAGGQSVQLSDFHNKIVLLYFGYTFCPDVCPTTLANLARVRRAMGVRATDVQVVMITVDPQRDTPDHLNTYVKRFDPSFVGLSGNLEQISDVASAYGIFFQSHATPGSNTYTVDHTPSVTVIDQQGDRRLLESYEMSSGQIADDLRALLND